MTITHDQAQDIIRRIDWAIEEMENVKKVVRMYEEEKKEMVSRCCGQPVIRTKRDETRYCYFCAGMNGCGKWVEDNDVIEKLTDQA